ncbi:lipid-binding protein [Pontibacter chinhatensis]|uniref:Lipid-binding putative hydrolase n=1 Tax=Pontibacter chinhatensis TaxID=1436961 RepID=A0A1I2RUZ2_9BACT|nr:lipid-binding protein [Pontibacter chinhatensis]SFG43893.1 Lipid-binding putative hydrolase [Pontibacter chinhatensis]
MKLKYTLLLTLFLSLGVFSACDDDDDDDIDYTATYPISGTWSVTFNIETAPGQFEPLTDLTEVLIYNTAANVPTEVWIDDEGNVADFKVKTPINIGNLTFGGENLANDYEPTQVTITDGQVFLNAVEVNNVLRDSIYFRVSFSDDEDAEGNPDPFGTIYHVYGHRSSGFE